MVHAFIHLKMEPEDVFSLLNQVLSFHNKDILIYILHVLSEPLHFHLYDSNLPTVLLPCKLSGLCDENIHQHDEYGRLKVQIMLTNEY